MAVTRIKNNQITDLTVNAAAKLQDFSITSGKIANNLTYGSDLTIAGNLTVQGNVTAIDTTDLVVEDPLILLAKDQTGSPSLDIGFIGKRGTEDNIAWIWDESADEFAAVFTTSEITNTTISINSYASIHALDITAANLDLSGNIEFSGNIVGNFVVTGNVDANNFNATTSITAVSGEFSGNVLAGNLESNAAVTGVTITASGNLEGNNAVITNDVAANTGTFTGNVSGDTFLGNIDGDTGTFTGNVSSDTFLGNIDGDTGTFTGNVSAGNISTTGVLDAASILASGNITGNNLISNNDVTTATVTASGNIIAANVNANTNVTATTVTASGNVDAGTAVNANLIAGTSLQIVSTGDLDLQPSGNISASGVLIRDVADPELAQDAATKQYVDDAVSAGIHIHTPVDVETPTALPAATYNQGGTLATVTDTIAGNTVVFSSAISPQVNDQLWFANSFEGIVANIAYFVVSAPNTSAAVLTTQYNGTPVSNITSNTGLSESVRVNSGHGANLVANAAGALTVDGYAVSAGNRVLVYNQSNAVENGIYVVSDAGNGSASWVLTRSDDANSYIPDSPVGLDEGTYVYVKYGDTGAGESYVMTAPQGPFNIGAANVTFTQFSASQVYSANTQAGLVLTGTVFSAKVDDDTTAFDGGGNIIVKTGANLVTPNIGDATGNSLTLSGNGLLSATTVEATGNVLAGNVNSNAAVTGVTITASGNLEGNNAVITNDVSAVTISASGNVLAGNVNSNAAVTGVTITASGNLEGNNAVITNDVDANNFTATGTVTTPNVTSAGGLSITTASNGNIDLDPNGTGNIILTDQTADRMLFTGPNQEVLTDANATFDGANLVITGSVTVDNVIIDGDSITSNGSELVINEAGADVNFRVEGDTQPNLLIVDAGSDTVLIGTDTPTTNAALKIGTTNSMLIPVGNTQQRPDVPVTGMIRFNTTIDNLEFYDADSWTPAGSLFTVITADEFNGDGSTVQFTLAENSTTAGTIVSINGVVQQPITAYSVTGNVLTFTEAPESTDVIDARVLTTTTTVTALQNTSGNAIFEALDSSAAFSVTGNLLPAANITYNLGSDTLRWNDIYLANSTIYLGNAQISANSSALILTNPSGVATVFSGASSSIEVAEIIKVGSNGVGNIGSASSTFDTVFAKATSAQYADLAEMYEADAIYEPGTVVCFGGTGEITACVDDSCRRVAGVVSTNPSYIMNAGLIGDYATAVALTGRVPCRVTGLIRKGDMLVAAGQGRARAESEPRVGSVIGKALADFDGQEGVIEVVVGRL